MSKRKDIEALLIRISNLEHDIQLKDLDITELYKRTANLTRTLVEAGILEPEWKPEAPKGSAITPNPYDPWLLEPTYTKINKVWE